MTVTNKILSRYAVQQFNWDLFSFKNSALSRLLFALLTILKSTERKEDPKDIFEKGIRKMEIFKPN